VARNTLSATGLRRLLGAVDPVAHDGDGEYVPDSVLAALAELIGCDDVTFQVMDVRREQADCQVFGPDEEAGASPELLEIFWRSFWDSPACCYPQRTGDHTSVTRLSDFYTRVSFRKTLLGAYFAATGMRHEITVPLPPDGERDRRLMLFRSSGSDFTDADALALHLLRPHLITLHLRQRRRHEGVPDLTPRQMQILTLVAAGLSNVQVARALGLSETTVGKHLENVYTRLDVNSRTAAVAKIYPLLGDHTATAAPVPSASPRNAETA
jgi:DNA-binding CsgD family transcriptional regulator